MINIQILFNGNSQAIRVTQQLIIDIIIETSIIDTITI